MKVVQFWDKVTITYFLWGFFSRFLLQQMQYSSFGSVLREAIKTTKLRVFARTQGDNPLIFSVHLATRIFLVVAVSHSDNPQLFLEMFRLATRKNLWSLPWVTATNLSFLLLPFSGNKKKLRVVAMSHGDHPKLCCFDCFH